MGPEDMSVGGVAVSSWGCSNRHRRVSHTLDETREEGLVLEVLVVLLEVLLAGGDELQGNELVAACDVCQQMARAGESFKLGVEFTYPRFSKREMMGPTRPRYTDYQYQTWSTSCAVLARTWTPSGLIAMKLFHRQFMRMRNGGVESGRENKDGGVIEGQAKAKKAGRWMLRKRQKLGGKDLRLLGGHFGWFLRVCWRIDKKWWRRRGGRGKKGILFRSRWSPNS